MLKIRHFPCSDYGSILKAMMDFSSEREQQKKPDEIWFLEHNPVYTQGLRNRHETRNSIHGIPLICTNRGGDITYHGPGQLVVYLLLDLAHRPYTIHELIVRLETLLCAYLKQYHHIEAYGDDAARGVYVANRKIASIGLRASKGRFCYHGFSLNVQMDLTPFSHIDPCGHKGMAMTQICDISEQPATVLTVACDLKKLLLEHLALGPNYEEHHHD